MNPTAMLDKMTVPRRINALSDIFFSKKALRIFEIAKHNSQIHTKFHRTPNHTRPALARSTSELDDKAITVPATEMTTLVNIAIGKAVPRYSFIIYPLE
jgi:hypothetical protein